MTRQIHAWSVALAIVASACTRLGPMPATTGLSAVPIGRPGVQAAVGPVPGFYASRAAQNQSQGAPILSLSALVDPDRWLGVKGLILGARLFGEGGDTAGEPYAGYRRRLNDSLAVGGVLFGSSKRAEAQLASYHGVRIGGEGAIDATLWQPSTWFGLHAQAAASVTRIDASGTYCVDNMGIAKDCNTEDPMSNVMIDGDDVGVYPAATGQLAIDVGPHDGTFDSARLALLGSIGSMPLIVNGEKANTGTYFALGLTLTIGLGLGRPDAAN